MGTMKKHDVKEQKPAHCIPDIGCVSDVDERKQLC